MTASQRLIIDFGSIVGSFLATANDLPAIVVLVVIVMGIVLGAAFVSSRRRQIFAVLWRLCWRWPLWSKWP
jgi:hypothetical protein